MAPCDDVSFFREKKCLEAHPSHRFQIRIHVFLKNILKLGSACPRATVGLSSAFWNSPAQNPDSKLHPSVSCLSLAKVEIEIKSHFIWDFLLQNTYHFCMFCFLNNSCLLKKKRVFWPPCPLNQQFSKPCLSGVKERRPERNCHSLTITAKIVEIAIELGTLCAIVLCSSAGVLHDGGLDGNIFGQVPGKTMGKKGLLNHPVKASNGNTDQNSQI